MNKLHKLIILVSDKKTCVMDEKLDKIIEMLEDITIKLEYLEIEVDEIKNGESESSVLQRLNLSEYSLKLSEIRLEAFKLRGSNKN